mmetsp:Transcript_4325/g.12286  ORF Transcript_4325/g.12286 Transcript_4325/m.12286 type:complete len:262 (-) Transcript_4325:7-792(-)
MRVRRGQPSFQRNCQRDPRHQLQQRRSSTPHIHCASLWTALLQHLRSHVQESSRQGRRLFGEVRGPAKIGDPERPILGQQKILGFDISVKHTHTEHVAEPKQQLSGPHNRVRFCKDTPWLTPRECFQVTASAHFHANKDQRTDLSRVVHRQNVPAPPCTATKSSHLSCELTAHAPDLKERSVHDLHRRRLARRTVQHSPDLRERALAEQRSLHIVHDGIRPRSRQSGQLRRHAWSRLHLRGHPRRSRPVHRAKVCSRAALI